MILQRRGIKQKCLQKSFLSTQLSLLQPFCRKRERSIFGTRVPCIRSGVLIFQRSSDTLLMWFLSTECFPGVRHSQVAFWFQSFAGVDRFFATRVKLLFISTFVAFIDFAWYNFLDSWAVHWIQARRTFCRLFCVGETNYLSQYCNSLPTYTIQSSANQHKPILKGKTLNFNKGILQHENAGIVWDELCDLWQFPCNFNGTRPLSMSLLDLLPQCPKSISFVDESAFPFVHQTLFLLTSLFFTLRYLQGLFFLLRKMIITRKTHSRPGGRTKLIGSHAENKNSESVWIRNFPNIPHHLATCNSLPQICPKHVHCAWNPTRPENAQPYQHLRAQKMTNQRKEITKRVMSLAHLAAVTCLAGKLRATFHHQNEEVKTIHSFLAHNAVESAMECDELPLWIQLCFSPVSRLVLKPEEIKCLSNYSYQGKLCSSPSWTRRSDVQIWFWYWKGNLIKEHSSTPRK